MKQTCIFLILNLLSVQWIWLTLRVASRNVGPVIKEVAGLCGKIPNKLPSRSAVDNFNDRKLAISQKHLGAVAASKSTTTLYTDETRKNGHT